MTAVPVYDPDRPIPVVLTEGLVRDILYGLQHAAEEYTFNGDCNDCSRSARESGNPYQPCEPHGDDFRKAGAWLEAAAQLEAVTGVKR
ncbi:hypothetical protein ACIBG7_12255 [Nonomuraea sp. NPDC050328]|uniref:hypothetical protein n=1 Tax=Nonomuraea sp. NPDC050328 TaxID=3364361 RepID=UPI0037902A2F